MVRVCCMKIQSGIHFHQGTSSGRFGLLFTIVHRTVYYGEVPFRWLSGESRDGRGCLRIHFRKARFLLSSRRFPFLLRGYDMISVHSSGWTCIDLIILRAERWLNNYCFEEIRSSAIISDEGNWLKSQVLDHDSPPPSHLLDGIDFLLRAQVIGASFRRLELLSSRGETFLFSPPPRQFLFLHCWA